MAHSSLVSGIVPHSSRPYKAAMNGAQLYFFWEGQMDSRISVWAACQRFEELLGQGSSDGKSPCFVCIGCVRFVSV